MNPLIIILGVVVIFLLYQLYSIYVSVPTQATNIFLGSTTQVVAVPTSSITNPGNTNYTIGFWIYINSFSQSINEFIGFGNSKSNDGVLESDLSNHLPSIDSTTLIKDVDASIPNNVCTFSMDDNSPTLYVNVLTSVLKDSNTRKIQSIPITNNLPIQTWTYVLVSVSSIAGPFVDCYINGKLVTSQQLADGTNPLTPINMQSTSGSGSGIANTILYPAPPLNQQDRDIYLNKISWIPKAVDPQTVWGYYNEGNGNPTGSGTLSSYHLKVIFTANESDSTFKIF